MLSQLSWTYWKQHVLFTVSVSAASHLYMHTPTGAWKPQSLSSTLQDQSAAFLSCFPAPACAFMISYWSAVLILYVLLNAACKLLLVYMLKYTKYVLLKGQLYGPAK